MILDLRRRAEMCLPGVPFLEQPLAGVIVLLPHVGEEARLLVYKEVEEAADHGGGVVTVGGFEEE